MKFTYILLLLTLSSVLIAQENWKPLIENENLEQFEKLNGTANFEYENGILTGITKSNTRNTFLATKAIYSDFILEFEVKIEYGMNSGVQFRSEKRTGADQVFGYQAEIETSQRKWAGGIYDQSRRGWLYPLSHNELGQNAFINGTWNKYRIEAIGNHIKTWVNNVPCANLVDAMTNEGFIAFQIHEIGQNETEGKKVQWKNIRILTENLEAAKWKNEVEPFEISYLKNELTKNEIRKGWRLLWDGKTTEGWRSVKSKAFPEKGWRIENGLLKVANAEGLENENSGDIMTIDEFSNFELVVDFKISTNANSGIKYCVNPDLNAGNDSAYGLEFQILDDETHLDAKKGTKGNRTVGSLYDLIPAGNLTEANRNTKRFNKWTFNRARIIVKNGQVEHWLNEVKILEYDIDSPMFDALIARSKFRDIETFGKQKKGHILLQNHGELVEFMNIKIREF